MVCLYHLLWVDSSDIAEDVLEWVLTELQPPHELREVGVDEGACCATLLVPALGPHAHVLHLVGVCTRRWVDELNRVVHWAMLITDGADHVIGLYRAIWLATIVSSRTSTDTQTVVMCTMLQCKLRSLSANSGMWNVICIVT